MLRCAALRCAAQRSAAVRSGAARSVPFIAPTRQPALLGPTLTLFDSTAGLSEPTLDPFGRDFGAQWIQLGRPGPSKVMVSLQRGAKITKSYFYCFCCRKIGPKISK